MAVVIVLAAAAVACGGAEGPAENQQSRSTVRVSTTRGDDISLTGRITAAYGAYVFAVGSGVERAIVVLRSPIGITVGKEIHATGRVRIFRRKELELELGINLGEEANGLENRSCLVATVAHVQ